MLRVSLIRSINDKESFNFAKVMGMNVVELKQNEEVDSKINELIANNCKNIIVTNEVAGFSEDIIKKYGNSKDINIYIAPSKRK